jgi:hypothetical protein
VGGVDPGFSRASWAGRENKGWQGCAGGLGTVRMKKAKRKQDWHGSLLKDGEGA